jgi:hypothetical protein
VVSSLPHQQHYCFHAATCIGFLHTVSWAFSQQLYGVPKAVTFQGREKQLNQCCCVANAALCVWLSLFKFVRSRFELTACTSCHLWSCLSMTCKIFQKLAKFPPCRTMQYCLFTRVIWCWPHTNSKLGKHGYSDICAQKINEYHQNFHFPWQVHFLPVLFDISCLARLYMVW